MTNKHTRRGDTQEETNQNNRHDEESLLSISSVLTTQGGDPEQKRFRMTLWNNGAFTLIELLVAVLIIGILAAVALPQYNKAVKKAQGREVLVALDALEKGISSYYLTNGLPEGQMTSEELDIIVPELKYFKYAGTDYGHAPASSTLAILYTYKNGTRGLSSALVETELVGTGVPSVTFLWPEKGPSVRICQWNCGKSGYSSCDECKKYFNCKSMQVGTSTQDCVL